MGVDFDGFGLIDLLLEMSISKADPRFPKILQIYKRHGIGAREAIAIMLELSAVLSEEEKDES